MFVDFAHVVGVLKGKRIAVVGSGPSVLENEPGFVDGHDVVVRVNNYRTSDQAGYRANVHYSFYGTSIRKTADELKKDGVTLCLCKCPNGKPIASEWHEKNGKQAGIDFRYIYSSRADWWFCDTYVPDDASFVSKFEALDRHIPTTGFAAILDVLACEPAEVYCTGFDFFTSGIHNVNEPWRQKNTTDPIGHRPDLEAGWLRANRAKHPLGFDATLEALLR